MPGDNFSFLRRTVHLESNLSGIFLDKKALLGRGNAVSVEPAFESWGLSLIQLLMVAKPAVELLTYSWTIDKAQLVRQI
jgi:hypothetical protein